MAKFLYFQDGHAKGKNSINRQGDYFADWLVKFDELIAIAKENEVAAILDGGDLLDSPIVSYSVCDAIVDRIEKAEIDYCCLFGNHSERYHSKEHSFDTTLAHILRRSKYFKYLDCIMKDDYAIFGREYNHNIEQELKERGIWFEPEHPHPIWTVAIVHAFICPEPFPYASHIVCDDIDSNGIDLVLVAHYHKAWQKKVRDTQYLDIGCFGRNSITEANIEPSCVLLDTEKRSYEIIKLKSAKRPEECFNLDKIKKEKQFDSNIDTFVQSLESLTFQGQSIENIVKNVAKDDNTKQEVVDLIIQKIDEVSNES